MSRPPARWADTELPEHVSKVLDSAHAARDEDAAALARMRARLSASLGPSFETRATVLTGQGSKLLRWKWLAGGALVALGVSLLLVPARRAPEHEASVSPAATSGESEQTEIVQAAPAAASGESGETEIAAEPAVSAPVVIPEAKRRPPHPVQPRPQQTAKPGLAEELRGIEQIRQLLMTSPTRALAAADEQQRRFAGGALTPERELLRVEALVRSGRIAEAKARAASNKQYRAQLERLLAAHPE
jgi:hypothetical protein